MASAHTPGPWSVTRRCVVERPVVIHEHIAIAPQGGPTFAFLPIGRGAREDLQVANAKLLVAAPRLADQLEEALGAMRAMRAGAPSLAITIGLLDCIDSSRAELHAAGRDVK